ncbi:phosphoesterase PA-phosphatase [Rhodanobacter thiooxydans]|uniref:Phosphoesterase PA-phosphatase n=1 Tax=Rhodanobacter thiooxydans TaxID=416169 RepID=A0A154QFA7_9GAMM|nr:phosphatase PAP2 family protein [Rhodanobacter thiooxydans]EIM03083.1 phosphoesterase PA-phosphatase-like protein [Rhodanobacter thiooxydans LCS2]KZC22856.1 phosphoesterase PA-phosphatase [Rhodanobacter thiooxydans]MCW0200695.1 phosphatase PAP2 family protein [Rhodanobacter thiooxydans]
MPASRFWLFAAVILFSGGVRAGDGPFGIDHRVHYDNSGIWNRSDQNALLYGTIGTVVGGALVFGDNDQLGDTFWRSVDAMVVTGVGAEAMKYTFQRKRPSQTDDPDKFFAGGHAHSFPSGEVAAISAAITPFIVTYGRDHPAVYALALLPAYDAVARVKTHGHWQSDVLVGAALGTGIGLWAAHRDSPLIVSWLPGGFKVGFIHRFK